MVRSDSILQIGLSRHSGVLSSQRGTLLSALLDSAPSQWCLAGVAGLRRKRHPVL